jgi:DNA-binding transcriptional MerR regulator
MGEPYTIGDLSREFDVTPRTIRFYEDEGLLSPARHGRNRVYGPRERIRLKLILRGKRLGFSLGDIREMINLYDLPRGEARQLLHVCSMIRDRRANLEQQRKDIENILHELEVLEQSCVGLLSERRAG